MSEVVVYGETAVGHPRRPRRRKSEARPEPEQKPHAHLESLVNRLTRLTLEKQEAAQAIKDVAEEAKSAGYSKKALLGLVKRNMESAEQRAERLAVEEEIDRMAVALGMLVDTPLGSAAMRNGNGSGAHP